MYIDKLGKERSEEEDCFRIAHCHSKGLEEEFAGGDVFFVKPTLEACKAEFFLYQQLDTNIDEIAGPGKFDDGKEVFGGFEQSS